MNRPTLAQQTQQALNEFLSALPADQRRTVAAAFEELLASNVARDACRIGDNAPLFNLPNLRAGNLDLQATLSEGPVVLSFYRGSWCPFCNLELNALQQHLPAIRACGARLIAISPEQPEASLGRVQKLNLEFDVLSDLGNRTARDYGLIMNLAETLRPLYLQWGIDLSAANGDESYQLPVPATYVIDSSGVIRAAYIEKDYTKRMEPDDIIDSLQALP